MTPFKVSPVVTKRQSAMSSLREPTRRSSSCACLDGYRQCGRGTTVPVRSASETAESARRVGSCRGGPGHCRLWRGLVPAACTALVRRARQTGVARHRFAVTHWSRQHLIDEHISRFNADADDPGHLPNTGVCPGLRLLLQPFLTGVLDLPDLTDDKA